MKRSYPVDFLRAIAILGVMVIHTLALCLGTPAVNQIWNYLHFVVVAFVFCAGYVTPRKTSLQWFIKRFKRIYFPYVLYVAVYSAIHRSSPQYILSSLLLISGIDIGWFPLMFLQLTVITPLLLHLKKYRVHVGISLIAFTLVTTFIRIPESYSRLIAWLPWSLIYLMGMEHMLTILQAGFLLWLLFLPFGLPTTLTLHKYPPDLYYFSYALGITGLLYQVSKIIRPNALIQFLSIHSYGLFFVHLLVLQVLPHSNILVTLVVSIGSSILFFVLTERYITHINPER